ncbi:MAG: hypothetical protein WC516_06195 [Patescibacteria group bacterium]|jgi:hypothetical protein
MNILHKIYRQKDVAEWMSQINALESQDYFIDRADFYLDDGEKHITYGLVLQALRAIRKKKDTYIFMGTN